MQHGRLSTFFCPTSDVVDDIPMLSLQLETWPIHHICDLQTCKTWTRRRRNLIDRSSGTLSSVLQNIH